MTVSPAKYNVTIYQGATFTRTFTWKDSGGTPVNLTGFTAKAQFKPEAGGAAMVTLTDVAGLTLGGVAGTIALVITATQTKAFKGSGQWDLLLTSAGGEVTRLLEGSFTLDRGITQ